MVNIKSNFKLIASTTLALSLLTACQGQNPFKRESDPLKNYPHTTESANRPYVPGSKATGTVKAGEGSKGQTVVTTIQCFEPVKIEAEPNHGNLLLKFVEDKESTYNLKITVNGPDSLKSQLKAAKPEDSQFLLIARQDNIYTYKFTWKPAKGISAQSPSDTLIIGFDGLPAPGACASAKNRLSLNLVVSKTNSPSISFSGLTEKIKFGDKFDFKVHVEDSTASKGKTPVIKSIQFAEAKGSSVLDASEAVTACEESKQLSESKFEFVCHFDSNLIKGVEKLLSSGKEGIASFQVTATSKIGGDSAATPQKIKVLFEKIETATEIKSAPLPPPRPKDLPSQPSQGAKK